MTRANVINGLGLKFKQVILLVFIQIHLVLNPFTVLYRITVFRSNSNVDLTNYQKDTDLL